MSLYSASLLVLAAQFLFFLNNEVRSFFLDVWFWFFVRGGPEPLEKECHEILTSKREDRFSDPFFELVKKTCQVQFLDLLRLGNFWKGPRTLRKFPQKCQNIARC